MQLLVELRAGGEDGWRLRVEREVANALPVFEEACDHAGLARAWHLVSFASGTACRFAETASAAARSLEHVAAGDVRGERRAATAYGAAAVFGPTPVAEAIETCERMRARVQGDRHSEGLLLSLMASLHAMAGAFDRARASSAAGIAMLEELGLDWEVANAKIEGGGQRSWPGTRTRPSGCCEAGTTRC